MERFKITEQDGIFNDNVVFKCNTTQECYEFLKKQDMGLTSYIIECLVDDIEVNSDDFMAAFKSGECPTDLQFF